MTNTYATQIQLGDSVYGSDGEKIGDVAGIASDHFIIEKGFIFTTDLFVPMSAVAGFDDDGVRLTLTKDQIENEDWSEAPVGGTDPYAADAPYAGNEATEGSYETADAGTTGDRLERREEQLTVDTRAEHAGTVHVGKHVEEERQSVDVPVQREEVTLERHAVDRPASGEAFTEDSIDVPVYEERVEAGKEARVVEELEVSKRTRTGTAHVEDTVRREEFDIDDDTSSIGREGR